MNEILLMLHVLFGGGCNFAAVWVFVDALNSGDGNLVRIRCASRVSAVSMWLAFIAGGYWHFGGEPPESQIAKWNRGGWPAHTRIYRPPPLPIHSNGILLIRRRTGRTAVGIVTGVGRVARVPIRPMWAIFIWR